MRQGWREVASDGAVRRYESRVETAAAEVEPEDSDAGAVLRTMSQVFDRALAIALKEES